MIAGVMSSRDAAFRRMVRCDEVESSSRYIQNDTVRSFDASSGECGTTIDAAPSNHAPAPPGSCPGPASGATRACSPWPDESSPRPSSNVYRATSLSAAASRTITLAPPSAQSAPPYAVQLGKTSGAVPTRKDGSAAEASASAREALRIICARPQRTA